MSVAVDFCLYHRITDVLMSKRGLRNTEPHFAAGRVVSLSFYQVAYELLTDVYVAVVQHVDDNPFYSDTMLQRAKTFVPPVPSLLSPFLLLFF